MLEQECRLGLIIFDPESAAVSIGALIIAPRRVLPTIVMWFDTKQVLVVIAGFTDVVLWPVLSRWRRLILGRLGLLLLSEGELRDDALIKRWVSLVKFIRALYLLC